MPQKSIPQRLFVFLQCPITGTPPYVLSVQHATEFTQKLYTEHVRQIAYPFMCNTALSKAGILPPPSARVVMLPIEVPDPRAQPILLPKSATPPLQLQ
jgi:hypothetical protein